MFNIESAQSHDLDLTQASTNQMSAGDADKALLRNYIKSQSVSTQNLNSSGGSSAVGGGGGGGHKMTATSAATKMSPSNDSPSSSGGASQLTSQSKQSQNSKGQSSATSSTLTAGSGSRYIQGQCSYTLMCACTCIC